MKYIAAFVLVLGLYFISNCSGTHNVHARKSLSESGYHAMDLFHHHFDNYTSTWNRLISVSNTGLNDNNGGYSNGNDDFSGLDKSELGDDGHDNDDDDENSQRLGFDISDSDRDVLPKNFGKIPIDELLYIDDDDNAGDGGAGGENSDSKSNGKYVPIDEFLYYNDDENEESYEGEFDDHRNPVGMPRECHNENLSIDNDKEDNEDVDENKDSDKDSHEVSAEERDEVKDEKWADRIHNIKASFARELFNMFELNN